MRLARPQPRLRAVVTRAASASERLATSLVSRSASAIAGVMAGIIWLGSAGLALADSPSPTQAVAGDPRAGEAPGFVGDPGLAIVIVVLVILVSVIATLAWVRATGGPTRAEDERR